MDEKQNIVRRDGDDYVPVEKRSATELIVGLGAPTILAAGHIAGKVIDRLPKKEQGESKKEN